MSGRRKVDELDLRLERLLLAIYAHGPNVIFEPMPNALLEYLRCNYRLGFMQVIETLREAGMDRQGLTEAVLGEHARGCACWRCVLALNADATQALARRMAELDAASLRIDN